MTTSTEEATFAATQEIEGPLKAISVLVHEISQQTSVQTIDALKAEIVHAHDALLPLLDLLGERHSAHNIHSLRYLLSSSVSASGLDTVNSRIKIHLQLDSGEPHISCDVEQLRQLLVNQITNSVDDMRQVGRPDISTRVMKGKVAIRFIDTGVGIPQEQLGIVFEYKDRGMGVRCWAFLKSKSRGAT
jgi:signal transduction histidine kinase